MPEIRAVIFDLDGTLIDTLKTYTSAFNQGIAGFDLEPVSEEKLASLLNRALGLQYILLELFPSEFKEPEALSRCLALILEAYLAELEKGAVPLNPGAKEALIALREMGLKIGIVTGRTTSGEQKWAEVQRLNIAQLIDSIVTGADAPRKPSPDGVVKCARDMGVSAEECVLVGDSQSDIVTGKAAGIMTIAIPTGVAKRELLSKEEPTALISSLAELPSLIASLNRRQSQTQQPSISKEGIMAEYEELFKFAAKAGSLEGYLYERDSLEPLSNWVNNMDAMYHRLPDNIRRDIKEAYAVVLERALGYGEKALTEAISSKLKAMLSELQRSA